MKNGDELCNFATMLSEIFDFPSSFSSAPEYLPIPYTGNPNRCATLLVLKVRAAKPHMTWLEACLYTRQFCNAPSVRYLVARATHEAKLKRRTRAVAVEAHKQRQFDWFLCGGRERAYARKYPFGGTHRWFTTLMFRETGCKVGPGVDLPGSSDWTVCQDCQEPEHCMCSITSTLRACTARTTRCNKGLRFAKSDESQVYRPALNLCLRGMVVKPPPPRSIMLLTKIRALRRALRTCTLVQYNAPVGWVSPPKPTSPHFVSALPQMDGLDGEEPATLKTSNVVLSEANPASFSQAAENEFRFDWHQLCSTEKTADYSHLTDRFTFYKSFVWKTTQLTNTKIPECSFDLPCDFVNSVKTVGTMPMFIPFKIHKYFKSDIEIKFHVNSNKFQVGQLQFSWHYLERYDGNKLQNIYSRSQLPHVVVNAGASNEATLYIPFKYMNPYLETVKRKHSPLALYLGTLSCYVVAPLATGATGPDNCNVSVFIRFPNVNFTGLRDGSIAEPQMEAAATAMVASAVVNKFIGDKNCDNPSSNVNPSYLVPTASHSWCAGKNITEQVQTLRLDNSVKAVGRRGIGNSETTIGTPCRVFGMLKHFTWSTVNVADNSTGSLLWSIDVHPQISKKHVYKYSNTPGLDEYAYPPVGVVAGMFRQWRGSLEFKFDIIASMFHTGRLLISYIPGFCGDASTLTLEQARNSASVEFSLQDCTSFTFVVPYIANVPFWQRQYSGPHKYSEKICPSKLVIFILNPLIPMESVVDHVVIVPYVRGGTDFEVSVLVQPANGLSDDINVYIPQKDKISPTPKSAPYRVTNYEGFGSDKKVILYEGTAALGTASTFLAPAKKLKKNEYFYGKAENPALQPTIIYNYWDGKQFVKTTSQVGYITLWSTDTGNYGIPQPATTNGEDRAREVARLLKKGAAIPDILLFVYDYIEDGTTSTSDYTKLNFVPQFEKLTDKISISSDSFDHIENEMDDQRVLSTTTLQPTSSLVSTSCGNFNFNESFSDLKDICRRYQLYFSQSFPVPQDYNSDDAFLIFPVIPSGLDLDLDSPGSTFNICRDGIIPLVANSYIFFRGSIRLRLIFSGFVPDVPISIWVQHHPDGDADFSYVQASPLIEIEDNNKSHGYAYYIQSMAVNNIIEFEVPFYQPGMYGLTRKRDVPAGEEDVHYFYSLGNIAIGAFLTNTPKNVNLNVKCFYSIGDDFSFNVFRGFNTVVFCDEVWPVDARTKRVRRRRPAVQITADPEMGPEMVAADPQMLSSWFNKMTKSTSDAAANAISSTVKEAVSAEAAKISDKFSELSSKLAIDPDNPKFLIHFTSQLGHILINPKPATIALAVGTFLADLMSDCIVNVVNLVSILKELISDYWHLFIPGVSGAVPQMAGPVSENSHMSTLCGLLFSAVCAFFGAVIAPPGKFPNVLRDISSSVSLVNNVIRLVQNCSETIVFCCKYAFKKIFPDKALYAQLYNEVPEIKKWLEECDYLTDVRVKSSYLYDRKMMTRIFDASVVGSILISNGINSSNPAGKLICDTQSKIRKLQNDLFERGIHPDVRFETFPIFITGKPGVGKSYLVKDLVKSMLEGIAYEHHGSLIYDIPSGAKYWSGCQNPAVLVSDDLFQVSGTRMEDELANIFLICSSSVLNPPMAAVEEKERRLNPLIYVQNCNSSFPNMLYTEEGNSCIEVRLNYAAIASLNEQVFRDASQIPRELRKNCGHLEMRYAFDVKDPETEWSDWMSYAEMKSLICEAFKKHYEDERDNFKQRMCDMYSLDPDFNENNIITEFPELNEQPSLKEQIDAYKELIAMKIDAYNDPQRDPDAWDWIRQKLEQFEKIRSDTMTKLRNRLAANPQMMSAVTLCLEDDYILPIVDTSDKPVATDQDLMRDTLRYHAETPTSNIFFDCKHKFNVDEIAAEFKTHYTYDQSIDVEGYSNFFFSVHHQTLLLDRLKTYVVTYLNLDANIDSEYFAFWEKFLNVGNFDLFEQFNFFSMFPNTSEFLVKTVVLPEEYCVKVKPLLRSTTAELVYSLEKENCLIYNDEYHIFLKKKTLRDIATNEIEFSNVHKCSVFIHNAFVMMFSHYFRPNKTPNATFDQLRASILDCKDIKDYANVTNNLVREIIALAKPSKDLYLVRVSAFNYLCALFRYIILGPLPFHKCVDASLYRSCLKHPKMSDFCHIQNKLVYLGGVIDKCNTLGCGFNNDMLYYFMCASSKSCQKFVAVKKRRIMNWSDFTTIEICRITAALSSRHKAKREGILADFGRYCLHLFCHTLPKVLGGLVTFILDRIPRFLILLTASIAIGGIFSLFSPAGECAAVATEPEGNYFKFDSPKHPVRQASKCPEKSFSVMPEGAPSQRPVMAKRLADNMVMLYAFWVDEETKERRSRSCRCLMLKGHAMLILRHYWEEYEALMKEGKTLEFVLFYNNGRSGLCSQNYVWSQLTDKVAWCSSSVDKITSNYGICLLPTSTAKIFKDITGIFASRSEHSNLASKCDFYGICTDPAFDLPVSIQNSFVVRETPTSSAVYCSTAYSYTKQCPGLCGCVLVCPTLNGGTGLVVGVHVAGDKTTGRGYAEPLYKEMFTSFFSQYKPPTPPEIVVVPDIEPKAELKGNMLMYGCVPPQFAHKESGKTKIVPSIASGLLYPVRTEVNPLRPGDPRQPPGSDPLRDGCEKHGSGDVVPFDVELVDIVKETLTDRMQQIIRPVRAQVAPLTLQQAVCGDVDVPYFESLNWKSSEGFPLSTIRPKTAHDKKWLFDLKETERGYELLGMDDSLSWQLSQRERCFMENTIPPTIYVDCLKDYRLTPEKCKIPGKTRIFSIAPIQCSIDIRQHCTDFTAALKNTRIHNSIAIGINPDSLEWTSLVNYLYEVGDKIITLDYSNYGPCLMSQLVSASIDCIVDWHSYNSCSDSHVKRVRWLLESDILNPVHLCYNLVYQTLNGISSGSPLTGELNSIPNLFYIRLVYLEIMKPQFPDWATMYYFDCFVRIVVYGDDLIMCVSDQIVSVFNAISIRDALKAHGITVTSAQKNNELQAFSTLEEATFLKRSFKPHPTRSGVWLGPIDTASIEECLNWIHKCEDPVEAFLESCRASTDLAYSQGPSYYNAHCKKIKDFCVSINKPFFVKTWHDRDNEIFGEAPLEIPQALDIQFPWFYQLLNSA
uniref:Genome polyprotein n=1 Tax=Picornavirales sp. TaxID=1955153 RepID=A0A6M9Z7H0_9VIRU|nr:MAG: polyprotein [Picornavirales sp.]